MRILKILAVIAGLLFLPEAASAAPVVTTTLSGPVVTTALTDGATIAVNGATGGTYTVTLGASGHTISNPTNVNVGQLLDFLISQDATGGRTVVWDTSYTWVNGSASVLNQAASSVTEVRCRVTTTTPTLLCYGPARVAVEAAKTANYTISYATDAGKIIPIQCGSVFDQNGSLPVVNSNATVDSIFSTTAPNTLVLGTYRMKSVATPTAGTGWTGLGVATNTYHLLEYKIFSAPQTNTDVPIGTGAGDEGAGLVDVVVQGSGSLAIDGTASTLQASGGSATIVGTLTTTATNEQIFAFVASNGASGVNVSAVSSANTGPWVKRALAGTLQAGNNLTEWSAPAAPILSSESITATFSGGTPAYANLYLVAVKGVPSGACTITMPVASSFSTGTRVQITNVTGAGILNAIIATTAPAILYGVPNSLSVANTIPLVPGMAATLTSDGTNWFTTQWGSVPGQDTTSGTSFTSDVVNCYETLHFTAGTAVTLTIPVGLPAGCSMNFVQDGVGVVNVVAGTSFTLNSPSGNHHSNGQYTAFFVTINSGGTSGFLGGSIAP